MTSVAVTTLIAAAGFAASVGSALLIAGIRWGRVIERLDVLVTGQLANSGKIETLTERVARIEGMLMPSGIRSSDGA